MSVSGEENRVSKALKGGEGLESPCLARDDVYGRCYFQKITLSIFCVGVQKEDIYLCFPNVCARDAFISK